MKKLRIEIAGHPIGVGLPPYIIAEAGMCHGGSFFRALALIDVAKESGADAIKFQHYNTETLLGPSYPPEIVDSFKRRQFHPYQILNLSRYAKQKGITLLCTAHDEIALTEIEDLVPAFKIGSGEAGNYPFLRQMARIGKPIIISLGLSTHNEKVSTIGMLENSPCDGFVVLDCVSLYPALATQYDIKEMFSIERDNLWGLSDHTTTNILSTIATIAGACVIESHFDLDDEGPPIKTNDSLVARKGNDFILYIKNIRDTYKARYGQYGVREPSDEKSRIRDMRKASRKSIHAVKDIGKGFFIREKDIVLKRPGTGHTYSEFKQDIEGRITRVDIKEGEIINKEKHT